ncbi:hypothetical protein BU23DRAFT_200214 [Bimuria novae-zelandiae CBS 107.79]|uniref:Uncharacterized protein n=1 Tax=Bimuria novae-zelandiae CBS 107.79 TaxID=1447943 RepID=A0A6A5V1W8_9PLEO|nr:hypothetical protein BU23DRAFT_200214 [Bimuria novae-zelandiae CBS 107.79]
MRTFRRHHSKTQLSSCRHSHMGPTASRIFAVSFNGTCTSDKWRLCFNRGVSMQTVISDTNQQLIHGSKTHPKAECAGRCTSLIGPDLFSSTGCRSGRRVDTCPLDLWLGKPNFHQLSGGGAAANMAG